MKRKSAKGRRIARLRARRSFKAQLRRRSFLSRRHLERIGHSTALPLNASRKAQKVESPTRLNFEEDRNNTLEFLNQIRAIALSKNSLYVNLEDCTDITPEAAVVLAASLDRARGFIPKKINGSDPKERKPYFILRNLRFHETFGVGQGRRYKEDKSNDQYMRLERGVDDKGPYIIERIRSLLINEHNNIPTSLKNHLDASLGEALLNCSEHAYPDNIEMAWPKPPKRRWWIAGYRDTTRREVKFMVYDQGATIPGTLPQSTAVRLAEVAKKFILRQPGNDAGLVAIAVRSGRSRTMRGERGRGLGDLARLIDVAGSGELRILSRGADYTYVSDTGHKLVNYGMPFDGTLIVWRLALP